jgi:hypothetical protein
VCVCLPIAAHSPQLLLLLQFAPPKVLTRLFDAHLQLRVYNLATKPVANFCVQVCAHSFVCLLYASPLTSCAHSQNIQKFLAHVSDGAVVDQCFTELKEHMSSLFSANRAGVVWRMVEACARTNTKQKEVVKVC